MKYHPSHRLAPLLLCLTIAACGVVSNAPPRATDAASSVVIATPTGARSPSEQVTTVAANSVTAAPFDTLTPSEQGSSARSRFATAALDYVAEHYQVARNKLEVVQEYQASSALLGQVFQAVTLIDRQQPHVYKLMVDHASGQVQEKAAFDAAERAASTSRYGKFQPELFATLQTLQPTQTVRAMIVLAAAPGASLSDIEAQITRDLAAKYPAAKEAVQNHRQVFDVPDRALARIIYDEFMAAQQAAIDARVKPFLAMLQARSIEAAAFPGVGAVGVTTSKRELLELAEMAEVGTIFAVSDKPIRPMLEQINSGLSPP